MTGASWGHNQNVFSSQKMPKNTNTSDPHAKDQPWDKSKFWCGDQGGTWFESQSRRNGAFMGTFQQEPIHWAQIQRILNGMGPYSLQLVCKTVTFRLGFTIDLEISSLQMGMPNHSSDPYTGTFQQATTHWDQIQRILDANAPSSRKLVCKTVTSLWWVFGRSELELRLGNGRFRSVRNPLPVEDWTCCELQVCICISTGRYTDFLAKIFQNSQNGLYTDTWRFS